MCRYVFILEVRRVIVLYYEYYELVFFFIFEEKKTINFRRELKNLSRRMDGVYIFFTGRPLLFRSPADRCLRRCTLQTDNRFVAGWVGFIRAYHARQAARANERAFPCASSALDTIMITPSPQQHVHPFLCSFFFSRVRACTRA